MKHALLLTAGLLIQSCTGNASPSDTKTETIHGIRFIEGALQIRVTSNGCTDSDSFILDDDKSQRVVILRQAPDLCRRRPFTKWVTLQTNRSFDAYQILNPIGPFKH